MIDYTRVEAKTKVCIVLTKLYGENTSCRADGCMCWVEDYSGGEKTGHCRLYEKACIVL